MISAREGYELWADTWDATPSPIVALEERVLLPWMERLSARRAIDVGCGTGRWASRLSAIGVDLSPAMLAVAARKPGLRGRLAAGDAAALPLASACADLLLCALTLGHVLDRDSAVREFTRVLEPRGTLILSEFHPEAVARGWRRTFRHGGRVYELEHHPYALDEIAGAGGLLLEESREATIGEPERALFAQAGRPGLFDAACAAPAVLLSRWTRL